MEPFLFYIAQYVRLSEAEKEFIRAHAKLRHFRKSDYYLRRGESKPRWCFVLSGLVAGSNTDLYGKEYIHWISAQHDYFTGTKHPFSSHSADLDIYFLQAGTVVELPLLDLREKQQQHRAFSEFLHLLKQRKLENYRRHLQLMHLPREDRYAAMAHLFPQLIQQLPVKSIQAFLGIRASTYYLSMKKYLRKHH
ncbi:hypothetical protein RYH73_01250 [Olivibacter sp. CPCC 100613]|uniref:Crp/Fnr family transcriptional regulator n=1 Tax=Olivibacter sp. CPCC 100613 TaxID=3079931 RepID=UPI002FFCC675